MTGGLRYRCRDTALRLVRGFRERFLDDFYFIHINKTGGSSVERALRLRHEHKTAREKRAEVGEKRWNSRFKFAFVRNPWDRAVSHYHFRRKVRADEELPDFAEWLRGVCVEKDPAVRTGKERFFLTQWEWVADGEDELLVDFVGRFERFGEDFEKLCDRLGIEARLPHLNPSKRGHYRDYYDAESAEIVRRYYADDVERFGYEF